jgi:hypothetical protein
MAWFGVGIEKPKRLPLHLIGIYNHVVPKKFPGSYIDFAAMVVNDAAANIPHMIPCQSNSNFVF